MRIFIDDQEIQLSASDLKGEGGEAEVYGCPSGVVKVYKQADHPIFQGPGQEKENLRQAARARLREMQVKLPSFPKNAPSQVVAPQKLAYNARQAGQRLIIGYTMPFIRDGYNLRQFSQRDFRESGGITQESVVSVFRDLHEVVEKAHDCGLVIADFNPFNVLVTPGTGPQAWVIDADSMQFDQFICSAYTPRYVDPLNCNPHSKRQEMVKPHSRLSDWYAFSMLFFECLLFVHPYGGVYKPKTPAEKCGLDERPLKRISVLHPNVNYPAAGIPYNALPDAVLDFYRELIEKDVRKPFPRSFLDNIRFQNGNSAYLAIVPSKTTVTHVVTSGAKASRIFDVVAPGVILTAAVQGNKLYYLYHKDGAFYREDGSLVLKGALDPGMRFRIHRSATVVSKGAKTFLLQPDERPTPISAEQFRSTHPMFDANGEHYYWVGGGQLWREGQYGPKPIGDVLENQTRIFVGPAFGFGFYQAGEFRRAFVFDAETGAKGEVPLTVSGKLVDMRLSFTAERAWLFVTVQEKGRLINRCTLIGRDGMVFGTAEAEEGSNGWLGSLEGKCAAALPRKSGAAHELLFATTDDGIVQVQPENDQLVVTRSFSGTQGLVEHEDNLLFATAGLYTWNRREIRLITTN